MNFIVRTTRRADRDAVEIFDWIARQSPEGARRWLEAFESAIQTLRDRADQCSAAPEAEQLGIDLRQMTFRTRHGRQFRALFLINGNVALLAAIRGAGQEIATMDDLELSE